MMDQKDTRLSSGLVSGISVLVLFVAGMLVGGCGGGAVPFSGAKSDDMLFVSAAQTWDINKDNTVTCDEWKQYTAELFTLADANADGVVGTEEYARIIKADRLFQSAQLGYFDANKDGKLTNQEFTERRNPAFDILDQNKDCQIVSAEMVRTRGVQSAPPSDGGAPAQIPGDSGRPR
ncbi:MAG: histidine kinase [Pseudomonadota bacterium]